MIITASSYDPNIHRYLSSYSRYASAMELRVVSFWPHISDPSPSVSEVNMGYPGHTKKYAHLGEMDDERWYLFTDMYDVVFQAEIPDLDKYGSEILVADEGVTWRQNRFFDRAFLEYPALEVIRDQKVYCSGTYAMKGKYFNDLVQFMLDNDGKYSGQLNQPLYNLWLHGKDYQNCSIFGTLCSNFDHGTIKKSGDQFFWEDGEIIPIVHGNGNYDRFL